MSNKTKQKVLTTLLLAILTLSSILVIFSTAAAQETASVKTYPFIAATPNPVQVNQPVLFHVGISMQTANVLMGWEGLSITIQKPDGQTETISNIRTDATGGTGVTYIPTMIGTYIAQSHYPEQVTREDKMAPGFPAGTIMLASDSNEIELIVQEEPISYWPGVPLPTEYWTRPINAQFYEWTEIAGDWLRPAGSYTMPPIPKYHPYNADAPETGHVLWTKPYTQGGLAGGELGYVQYEMGDAYENKFRGSIIMSGVLYYNRYEDRGGGPDLDQDVVAVDLKTGEELWVKNWNNERLDFGQTFFWDSYNYHGVFGYLWTQSGSTWKAYDPQSGRWEYTMENVPGGWNLYGPKGEIYRYTVNTRQGWMTLWNSSRVVSNMGSWRPQGNTYNCTWDSPRQGGYEWNVTIPTDLPGSAVSYHLFDKIVGTAASGIWGTTSPDIANWAIDVSPGHEGSVLFNKTVTLPESDLTLVYSDSIPENDVLIISAKENRRYYGFSLTTGNLKWTTEPEPSHLAFYDKWYGPAYGYGKFFTGRVSGIVTCYDLETGNVLWTYDVRDKYVEMTWSQNFHIAYHFLADGKICLSYSEHSPINPLPRGGPLVVLDVETGDKIWEISWVNNWWGGHVMIGDSTIVGLNGYDNRLYAIGKGPSAITVTVAPKVSNLGSKVVLEGFVTDISPGTQEYAITARFPNGVPAIADDSMSEWMQYVYMHFERPADAVGVPVKLEVVKDPNGNWYDIGTTMSDSTGFYSLDWVAPVPGHYVILASFGGSESYYGSYIETSITVSEAPAPATPIEPEQPTEPEVPTEPEQPTEPEEPTEPEQPTEPEEPTEPEQPTEPEEPIAPLISTEVAILIAVAVAVVIGVAAFWALRKRQ